MKLTKDILKYCENTHTISSKSGPEYIGRTFAGIELHVTKFGIITQEKGRTEITKFGNSLEGHFLPNPVHDLYEKLLGYEFKKDDLIIKNGENWWDDDKLFLFIYFDNTSVFRAEAGTTTLVWLRDVLSS